MNKKGFTLIELLAVIVILAIIAVIAIPKILNVVDESKKGAEEASALGYIDAVEKQVMLSDIDSTKYILIPDGTIAVKDLKNTYHVTVKGKYPRKGTVTIQNRKVVGYDIITDNYEFKLVNGTKSSNKRVKLKTVSFATDSWDLIKQAIIADETDNYHVGDEKTITVAAHTNTCARFSTFVSEWGCNSASIEEKQVKVRIANMSQCENNEVSQSTCGFVVEFADVVDIHAFNYQTKDMNGGSTSGGYPNSRLRTYINGTIWNSLPLDMRNVMIDTTVVSGHNYEESSNFTSTDKLYLLTAEEVYSDFNATAYDTSTGNSRQLDYYRNNNTTTSSAAAAIKKHNGTATSWMTRSSSAANSYWSHKDVTVISNTGGYSTSDAGQISGIAPAFRIG